MADCVPQLTFSFYRKPIGADFSGGQISSDAGLLLLRRFDQRHQLTSQIAAELSDARDPERATHALLELLRQRFFALCAGYEDVNDAQQLRHDPIFKLMAGRGLDDTLGSQPTLSRWENAVSAREVAGLNQLLLTWFVEVCGEQVRQRGQILLDVDSTDDPTHGEQQLSLFNGHYGERIYHPLLIFERHSGCLLDVRLRRGNCVSYNRVVPRLRRLVRRLQRAFPGVPIRLRADAGFAFHGLYNLLEELGVLYAIRLMKSARLRRQAEAVLQQVSGDHQPTQQPQQQFTTFAYRMRTWPQARPIACKAEHDGQSSEVYFIVTNLAAEAAQVFAFYNGRGECENRIAELKNGFHADRLSCHRFVTNAFRLLLHGLAYNFVNLFRHTLPEPLRTLQIEGLRQRLFKIGARVLESTRRVWVHLATGWPWQTSFVAAYG
jgi:Transposase DDE domain group 1